MAPSSAPTPRLERLLRPLQEFIQAAAAGGWLLLPAAGLALVLANSFLAPAYEALLHLPIGVTVGPYSLQMSLLHWVNDGLMALFFLLVGLEIKRELLTGELAGRKAAALPACAAMGGALLPALFYAALNNGKAGEAGWGIPMATDIAFTLACLTILGPRVPFGLKAFLTAVAIVDDLIAVGVIAVFYSGPLQWGALAVAAGVLLLLAVMGRQGVRRLGPYLALGVVVWLAVLQSGVHASVAGVLVAMVVPARDRKGTQDAQDTQDERDDRDDRDGGGVLDGKEPGRAGGGAPLERLEHALEWPVNTLIVPLFALANAGVALSAAGLEGERALVAGGIALGLLVGKPVGLVAACWLAVKSGVAALPAGVAWREMIGAGILAGIGFTMSLFIAGLAFDEQPELLDAAKIGVLAASAVAGLAGTVFLARSGSAG